MQTPLIRILMVYKYYIMIPLAIFEGPLLTLACGILLRLGFLSLVPTALILMGGDFIDDIVWYALGYWGGEKLVLKVGRFVGVRKQDLEKVKSLYRRHFVPVLFISKLTSGFGLSVPIVATAGISKVPFWKYMLVNIIGEPIWTAELLAVGYYSSGLYLIVSRTLQWFSIVPVILGIIVLFFIMVGYIRRSIFKQHA